MNQDLVKFEQRGAVAWITLHRPEAMNSLTPQLGQELGHALTRAEADESMRALVITGANPAFCAGADLKFVGAGSESSFNNALGRFLDDLSVVLNRIEASPLPTIAAVNGLALAGGLELVLCCDLVIAAESARIGDAHANYGLLPGGGGSVRLPRKIGPTRAKYLLYTGEFLPAADLVDCGLVNQVVPDDALGSTVQTLAEKIAAKSPLSIARVKQLVADGAQQPVHSALRQEINTLMVHSHSHDMREGLAAFNEKREPVFTGR